MATEESTKEDLLSLTLAEERKRILQEIPAENLIHNTPTLLRFNLK